MTIKSLYQSLFGRENLKGGTVIDMSEHGRVGGLSTGQPFKFVAMVDPDTGETSSTNVYKDFEGDRFTVGTTAVEITFTGSTRLISVQSDQDNEGAVYIGKSNVQSDGTNSMGRLSEGQAVVVSLNDVDNAIYVVSDTASQTVYKMALITS